MIRLLSPILVLIVLASPAMAQPIRANPGAARDYIVLRQPQADHEITLRVRPTDSSAVPSEFDWQRWDPNGGGYTEARRIRWFASASCSSGLDRIRLDGPGGPQPQNFGGTRNAISGRTVQDSFDPDALDAVCIAFARQSTQACGENPILEPGCQREETFIFGPTQPLPDSDPLTVSGSCVSGTLPTRQYVPRLKLTCLLGG